MNLNGDNTKKCRPENFDVDVRGVSINPIKFHLSSCLPNDRDWIQNLDENDADTAKKEKIKGIKNYATLISDMAVMVKNLDGNYKHTLNNLRDSYRRFLGTFVSVLTDFSQTISSITGILEEYIVA